MATTYESGSAVRSGYYFNAAQWHLEPVAGEGGRLPAGRGRWMRIPTAAALLLVPVLGAAFLVFLPLIGFLVTLQAITSPMLRTFHSSATDLAVTMTPGWRPGEAHFTGTRSESAGAEEKGSMATGDALDALAAEIERRRRNG
jgi:hypothetical protein